jgi:hypothetical protein
VKAVPATAAEALAATVLVSGPAPAIQIDGLGRLTYAMPTWVQPFRRRAERLCGKFVAAASSVVFLGFPHCEIPCGSNTAFVALTRRGWRMWYTGFFRHPQ